MPSGHVGQIAFQKRSRGKHWFLQKSNGQFEIVWIEVGIFLKLKNTAVDINFVIPR